MVNKTSALSTNYKIGSTKINDEIKITFQEIKNLEIFQISAWPLTLENINFKLSKIINSTHSPHFNKSLSFNDIHILRIEPLKFWIIGKVNIDIGSDQATILDLSHAFTSIEVRGSEVTNFFNRHLPLDLRDQSFPVNSIASSAIHHVSIKLWRTDKGYRLFIPRGFALSIWEMLLETASQFGYEII